MQKENKHTRAEYFVAGVILDQLSYAINVGKAGIFLQLRVLNLFAVGSLLSKHENSLALATYYPSDSLSSKRFSERYPALHDRIIVI